MRFPIILTALAVAVAAGCAKAPTPVTPNMGSAIIAAAKAAPVTVGQVEKTPNVRCACYSVDGTLGKKAFTIAFELMGKTAMVQKVEVAGKAPTAAEKAAIGQGVLAEAKEAFMQESTMSAERARQLFAVAAALGASETKAEAPTFKVENVAAQPVRCPCFTLTGTLGAKAVTLNYEVHNGFAGPAYEIEAFKVNGNKPTAEEIKAVADGLQAAGDEAFLQEGTHSAAQAALYHGLAKALGHK